MNYQLKFKDHKNNVETADSYYTFIAAFDRMQREWEDKCNDAFLADLDAERDEPEWRNYVEQGDYEGYAVLAHLDEDGPSYEWWVTKSKEA